MNKFDIAGHRKIWFLISLCVIIPGIICLAARGLNFGIDFTGGTIIDLHFEQPVTIQDVRSSLSKYDLGGSTIQLEGEAGAATDASSSQNVMIRTVALEEDQRMQVMRGFPGAPSGESRRDDRRRAHHECGDGPGSFLGAHHRLRRVSL